ncbi:serine/threonine-protein kinase [Streptosporangium sp. KLBMP 9127]|nr:serine/threonine protein kinase [Streptosporangium sp. KLBMP 9127]
MPHVEPLREDDPAVVGAYRIVGRLGAGGQGVVYLGQAPDGRLVAVKVLRDAIARDDRFAKEIAAARRVEPFCIAQVLDASLSGRPYIVSEYVEGPSLQQAGRHAGADLQRLAVSTATALAAIHQAGIVHRDLKPANVLLGRDGPRVIDFGIARATDASATVTSTVMGTPAYMAPEQLAGADVGPPADVFAWASVIVFAATGTPPFGEDTLPAIINRILHQEPRLGDLPQPLRSIVHACLDKDPRNRPAMRDVLLRLLGGPVPGPPPVPAPRRTAGRFPLVAGVAGALAASLVAVVAVVVWNADSPIGTGAQKLAAVTGAMATPSTTLSATMFKHRTPKPRKTRTPLAKRPTVRPTFTSRPTRERATTRPPATPTPTATRKRPATRPSPTPTPTPTKSTSRPKSSASFTLAYVRAQGSSKINDEGITCYRGTMNFGVGLDASQPGAAFSYQWIYNGKVLESGSSRLPAGSRSDYVTSKDVFQPPDGTHTVTYRITSPGSRSKSFTFTMCPTAP